MYTKTITMTKHSCRGKEFTCVRTMEVMDEYEREERRRERYEKRYADIRAYREHLRACEDEWYRTRLNPTSMSRIMDAYNEYMESEQYY